MPDSITMIPVTSGDTAVADAIAVRDTTGQAGDGYRVTVLDTGAPAAQQRVAGTLDPVTYYRIAGA